jgi:hypothetical protein
MTTQTTTNRTSNQGTRALFGATAITLTLLGGAMLWQMRPVDQPAASSGTTVSAINEGAMPMDVLAERYQDEVQVAAVQETARGGMAEMYADQEVATALGFSDSMSEANPPMGGLAELYRDQEWGTASAGAGRTASPCGLDERSISC